MMVYIILNALPSILFFGLALLQYKRIGPPLVREWAISTKQERKEMSEKDKNMFYKFASNFFTGLAIAFLAPFGYLATGWNGFWGIMLFILFLATLYSYVARRVINKHADVKYDVRGTRKGRKKN